MEEIKHKYENRTERATLTDKELTEILNQTSSASDILNISALFEAVLAIWCLDYLKGRKC
jgi:hypothetical protein